jgi:hypothetical protein
LRGSPGTCEVAPRLDSRIGAEFDHEPSSALGEQRETFGVDAFCALVVDEEIVEAFEADGFVLEDFGNVVGALIDVGIGEDYQNT